MPIARFKMPDGRVARFEVPEGTSPEQAQSMMESHFGQATSAKQESAPKIPEKSYLERIGQNIGNEAAGLVRGAGSIGSTLLYPVDAITDVVIGDRKPTVAGLVTGNQPLTRNQERRAAMDAALRNLGADSESGLYTAGKLTGEIAGTAGVGGVLGRGALAVAPRAPGIANALTTGGMRAGVTPGKVNMLTRVAGGAGTGAVSAGMIDPSQAGTGALIGGALPSGAMLLGKAGENIGRAFTLGGSNRDLARTAIDKYGIPLGAGDIAEGGTIKALRSILNDAPFSGGVGAAQRESVQEAYNRAIGGQFGAQAPKLTADVIDVAKSRMGAEFDRLWNQNNLVVDRDMVMQMTALRNQSAKLPKNEGASLAAEIDDLFGKMQQKGDELVIPGETANKFQSYLRRRAEGSAGLKNELGDLRQGIIGAFNRSIGPADAAALTLNRAQYKAFKTIEPLLSSAEAGVAGRAAGDVPAGLLPQAVAKQYRGTAPSDMRELSQIGSRFMVDRTPRTGGSMRAALQNTALGAALVGGGLSNPLLAAGAIPAAAGTNVLLGSPAVARRLLRDGGSQNALTRLIGNPEAQQLIYRAAPVTVSR